MKLLLCLFFFSVCVGYLSQYFSKYYNIYFSLLGIPYNYRKNKYTLEYRHLGSNCCNVLFTKNIMYNELKNYQIDFKYLFLSFFFLQMTYTKNYFLSINHGS